jgi:hypothetical protein
VAPARSAISWCGWTWPARPPSRRSGAATLPPVRPAPLDRLPGTSADDPFLRLAAAWLIGHPTHTATAYRRDLTAWATWCTQLGTHPLAAERHHVDAWVRHLTTTPQPRTHRPASPATVARRLSALSGFYDFGVHDAEVLTHSPVASVRRPRVSDESAAIGLTTEQLQHLLATATKHSPRLAALVAVLTFCGLRISEALGADIPRLRPRPGPPRPQSHPQRRQDRPDPTTPSWSAPSTPTSATAPADQSSWPPTGLAATRTKAPTNNSAASATPPTSHPGSAHTACATPTPPKPSPVGA